ncbi:MAG: hypothetical protein ACRC6E_06130 [Fusobacteriaceae bacterium]
MNYGDLVGKTSGDVTITEYNQILNTLCLIEMGSDNQRYVNLIRVDNAEVANKVLAGYGFSIIDVRSASFEFSVESLRKLSILLELGIGSISYKAPLSEELYYNNVGNFLAEQSFVLNFLLPEEKTFLLEKYGESIDVNTILFDENYIK